MQTATAAPLLSPADPLLVPAEHVHDAITRAIAAERELAHVRAKYNTMVAGMEYALAHTQVASSISHEGGIVVVYKTGAVYQLQDIATDAPGQSGYRQAWVALPALPDSIAALHADATQDEPAYTGMAVVL